MKKTSNPSTVYFDPDAYIESIMKDMGFDEASKELQDQMYKELNEQVSHLILNSISLYVEPEQIDETLVNYGDLKSLAEFIKKLAEISPEAQMAIAEALERFYAETIETYEHFEK